MNKTDRLTIITIFVIGAVIGGVLALPICFIPKSAPATTVTDCTGCHRKTLLTEFFKRHNLKSPDQLATAVLATRNPKLLSAIAVVENTPHTARNTGHKNRYSGAWQTHRSWGKVTGDVTHQALIAELALETHVSEEKSVVKGINAYGGESDKRNGKYAKLVLSQLDELQAVIP